MNYPYFLSPPNIIHQTFPIYSRLICLTPCFHESDLALDSQGNIFLTYYDATAVLNGDLRLITCPVPNDCSDSTNWNNVLIDSAGDIGSDTAIHIDLLDNIHISYFDL